MSTALWFISVDLELFVFFDQRLVVLFVIYLYFFCALDQCFEKCWISVLKNWLQWFHLCFSNCFSLMCCSALWDLDCAFSNWSQWFHLCLYCVRSVIDVVMNFDFCEFVCDWVILFGIVEFADLSWGGLIIGFFSMSIFALQFNLYYYLLGIVWLCSLKLGCVWLNTN